MRYLFFLKENAELVTKRKQVCQEKQAGFKNEDDSAEFLLYNLGFTILFPCQHTGFQNSPILKVFLATLCIQFSYLQMVPDVHDLTSI